MQVRRLQGKTLEYLAVEPDGYDPTERYPMVVLLHGFGASMEDLAGLCPAIDSEGYVYICPNAPMPIEIGLGMRGYAWSPPKDSGTPKDMQRVEEALAVLFEEAMERYRVAPGEAILGGFSQGGMMTYRCGLTSPDLFAGLVVLSSSIPDPDSLRTRLPPSRTSSIFIAHGTADSMISIQDARESRRFLEEEGYEPDYNEYPMGHEISQDVLNDLAPWIRAVLSPARLVQRSR